MESENGLRQMPGGQGRRGRPAADGHPPRLRPRRPGSRELCNRLMFEQHSYVDRCMLYVFRCAVYYAEGGREPEKLRWWNWKDPQKP
jgi:hypothetical protein